MGPDDTHPMVLKQMADVVAEPLFIIFEKSWLSGEVPSDWKTGNITPIFKKGRKEDPGNYRPVSLCAWEDHGADRPGSYDKAHTRFTKGRSCLTNLVAFYNGVAALVDRGRVMDVIYLQGRLLQGL